MKELYIVIGDFLIASTRKEQQFFFLDKIKNITAGKCNR